MPRGKGNYQHKALILTYCSATHNISQKKKKEVAKLLAYQHFKRISSRANKITQHKFANEVSD